jgi:hypothetical protein
MEFGERPVLGRIFWRYCTIPRVFLSQNKCSCIKHFGMISKTVVPISDLFEAHLTVSDLDRAIAFYGEQLGLPLARVFPERKVVFFWVGAPGRAMLGLWEAGTIPITVSLQCGLSNCRF